MERTHVQGIEATLKLIPDLIAKGFKLVTLSEMAEAKDVDLQNTLYIDMWDSSLAAGIVAGYNPEEMQM